MKAIVYHKYGPPDVLQLNEVDKPTPMEDEVLVEVHAASINSWDWDLLRGTFQGRLGAFRVPKFEILGADIAGIVKGAGKNVQQFRPGDAVFGDVSGFRARDWGGFAEYVCARENALVLKPASMTFEQAAAVPQAGVLALQGLRDQGRIKPGQKVLINGAGGGVGTFAVQIAKSFGAEVTGVDSTRKLDMLRTIGADHVIDYTREDFTRNGRRYDLILDVVGNRSIFDARRVLSSRGVYVIVGGPMPRILQVAILGTLISRTGSKKMGILMHEPNQKDLNVMKELFEAGKVVPFIDRRYPLSEVAEALRYFGEGHARGKVVIAVADNNVS